MVAKWTAPHVAASPIFSVGKQIEIVPQTTSRRRARPRAASDDRTVDRFGRADHSERMVAVADERRLVVADEYADGAELAAEARVSGARGTGLLLLASTRAWPCPRPLHCAAWPSAAQLIRRIAAPGRGAAPRPRRPARRGRPSPRSSARRSIAGEDALRRGRAPSRCRSPPRPRARGREHRPDRQPADPPLPSAAARPPVAVAVAPKDEITLAHTKAPHLAAARAAEQRSDVRRPATERPDELGSHGVHIAHAPNVPRDAAVRVDDST